jgi:hypothetical protein
MSKILYVCKRNGEAGQYEKDRLRIISDELAPDNIKTKAVHQIEVYKSIAYSIMMSRNTPVSSDGSVLLGKAFGVFEIESLQPGASVPDGNYALFRNNDAHIEIISDSAGTRTIWYYQDENVFIASTSQRAIIMYLGDFVFNDKIIPWMLSTGSLGPAESWDKRLSRLQAAESLTLDKADWNVTIHKNHVSFSPTVKNKEECKTKVVSVIKETLSSLTEIDYHSWVLPLSGGYDSRAILIFLKQIKDLPDYFRSITWGLESSIYEDKNDAKIAKELADRASVKHQFFHTDLSTEPLHLVLDRFLKCGEGRIDHLAAYMDGLDIWRRLYDEKIEGVIRGDEGFGWLPVSSELTVRLNTGCALCNDFKNLQNLDQYQIFPDQHLPKEYLKKNKESIDEWRDRLYHIYRLPTILSALSDIKFSYVEQINPLLSTKILKAVRELPDDFRTNKFLFKEIVFEHAPDIPIATKSANASPEKLLRSEEFVLFLKNKMTTKMASNIFSEHFLTFIKNGIEVYRPKTMKSRNKKGFIKWIKQLIPRRILFWIKDMGILPTVDGNKLAFRVFMIIRMNEILNRDKKLLQE